MKPILYRNLILLKPYLIYILVMILALPGTMILPFNNYIKIFLLGMLMFLLHVVTLAFPYYIYLRINKNKSEMNFLSYPITQITTVNMHYLTAIILILINSVTIGLYNLVALMYAASDMDVVINMSGILTNVAANLFTISLILPLCDFKRFLKIPLVIWIILIGFILPSIVPYTDKLLNKLSIQTNVFTNYGDEIFVSISIILFIITYVIAISKARKGEITI